MAASNDISTLLPLALAAHGKGEFANAMLLYQRIIDIDPTQAQAQHNLGAVYFEQGRERDAYPHFKAAFELNRDEPTYQTGFAIALYSLGDKASAEKLFRAALSKKADDYTALDYLAKILIETSRLGEALTLLKPFVPDNLVKPEFLLHYCTALISLQREQDALAITRQVYEQRKNDMTYLRLLGAILIRMSQFDEAVEIMRRTTQLEPQEIGNWSNLCAACKGAYRFDEGVKAAKKALSMDPLHFETLSNLGVMYREMDKGEEGLIYLRRAMELRPAYPNIHYNMGLNLVAAGYLREGWAEAEWRWQTDTARHLVRPDRKPQWAGQDIGTKTLCLFVDQGVGDTIQMCRFFPEIRRRAPNARIFLRCEPKLIPLLQRNFGQYMDFLPTDLHVLHQQLDFDYHHPLVSLLDTLSIDIDNIPGENYLTAVKPIDYRSHPTQKVIGISWHTRNLDTGYKRSLKLEDFAFLKQFGDDIKIINLQYGDTAEQRAQAAAQGLHVHNDDTVDSWADLQPFVDQVAGCDLVISIDNTTVHVAGALGIPVWTMIPLVPYWRWSLHNDRSPWYNSMRFYRQKEGGVYGHVLKKIETDLKAWLGGDKSVVEPLPYEFTVPPYQERVTKPSVALLNAPSPLLPLERQASGKALHKALEDAGHSVDPITGAEIDKTPVVPGALSDFDLELYASQWVYANPSLIDRIRRADEVILNGENAIFGTDPLTLKLLYLVYYASLLGKKISILNHCCFPEGGLELSDPGILAYYLKVYKACADVAVIDPISQNLLSQLGIEARLVPPAEALTRLPTLTGKPGKSVAVFLQGFSTLKASQLLDQIAPLLTAQKLTLSLPVFKQDKEGQLNVRQMTVLLAAHRPTVVTLEDEADLHTYIKDAAVILTNQTAMMTLAARLSKKVLLLPGTLPDVEAYASVLNMPLASVEDFSDINRLTVSVFDNAAMPQVLGK